MGSGATVVAAFRRHLLDSPRSYAPDTIVKRVAEARRWVRAVGDPWSANVHDVEQYLHGRGLSPSATRDAASHVRAFYRWAIRAGLTEVDPTVTVELPRARRRLPRPARDVAIGVAIAAAPSPAYRAILALAAGAGLRCCEIAGLRWVDVDMLAGTVHVTGKGGHERVVSIPASVRRALAATDAATQHVFTSPTTGRPYTAGRVSQMMNAYLRSIGAGCTMHQLRHRFATRALAASGDLTLVRDLLGHSTVAVTEIYAAVTPGAAGAVSAALDVPGLD